MPKKKKRRGGGGPWVDDDPNREKKDRSHVINRHKTNTRITRKGAVHDTGKPSSISGVQPNGGRPYKKGSKTSVKQSK